MGATTRRSAPRWGHPLPAFQIQPLRQRDSGTVVGPGVVGPGVPVAAAVETTAAADNKGRRENTPVVVSLVSAIEIFL